MGQVSKKFRHGDKIVCLFLGPEHLKKVITLDQVVSPSLKTALRQSIAFSSWYDDGHPKVHYVCEYNKVYWAKEDNVRLATFAEQVLYSTPKKAAQ